MLIGVTGHKGILAKSLIKYLKKKKFRISLYQHDILEYKKLSKWSKRVNIIIHLASVTSIKKVNENKNYARKVNFEATEQLVSFIKNTNKKLVFISSSHVYGSSNNKISETKNKLPISYYGHLKALSEDVIENNLNNYLIIRLFSYYSIFQSIDFLVPSLVKKIKELNNQKLKIKNYNHIRDISSVDFVANQICLLISKNINGIINCGSGKGMQIKDLAIKIAKLKFNKVVQLDRRFKTKQITQIICDNNKLKKITGIEDKDNLFKYL